MAYSSVYGFVSLVFVFISVAPVNNADIGLGPGELANMDPDLDQLNGAINFMTCPHNESQCLDQLDKLDGWSITDDTRLLYKDYLYRYCYMEKTFGFGDVSDFVGGLQSTVHQMQIMANVAQTDRLDSGTLFAMKSPRCGMCDIEGKDPDITVSKPKIKYQILNYPSLKSLMAPQQVKKDIDIAFRLWSDVIPVTFEPTKNFSQTDIGIKFGALRHGPLEDTFFDGAGGVIAHVYKEMNPMNPYFSGFAEIHFDDDEVFTRQQHFGMNLLYEAAHQIGHVLGLSHTDDRESIMWPFHKGFIQGGLHLSEHDIKSVQDIHGVRKGYEARPRTTTQPTDLTETMEIQHKETHTTCPDKFATAIIKGELHLLQGDRVYMYTLNPLLEYTVVTSPIDGYHINRYYKGLHINQDLAYTKADGNTVFIRGRNYWVYDGTRVLPDHPKKIKPLYRGIPKNTRAAFHDKYDDITYFFKGDRFWKYNDRKQRLAGRKRGFPLSDEFEGLPANITAAFSDGNGYRYLLKGQQVWLYRSGSSKLQRGYPKLFPRPNCQ